MWIRSQDKRILLDATHSRITYYEKGTPPNYVIEIFQSNFGWTILGTYSTEEKALKVLNMMEKHLENMYIGTGNYMGKPFQMPQDSEV